MPNRLIDRESNTQGRQPDIHALLLQTMQQEFPNDPNYTNGRTYASDPTSPLVNANNVEIRPVTDLDKTKRNGNKVVELDANTPSYTDYSLNKKLPTIDSDDLDELLDDEWDFFIEDINLTRPRTDGLFLINKDISLNPPDFHNEYIKNGPANIQARINAGESTDDVIKSTFCVFYIEDSTALPIPNYKTLEVMLVERDKTYNDIQEANVEQIKEFDLQLDGRFTADTDGTVDAYEEFQFRQVLDRSIAWNERVRFDSGYTVGFDENSVKFERDPGDYLLPPNQRQEGFYNIKVYQKQTYRERLREKYEGNLIALQWPIPYDVSKITLQKLGGGVTPSNTLLNDDKVFFVRMMINGYWKQVISLNVFRQYALLNNLNLSDITLDEAVYGPLEDSTFTRNLVNGTDLVNIPKAGLYGISGIINILKENGGLDVIQDFNITAQELDTARQQIILFITLMGSFGGGTQDDDGNLLNANGDIVYTKQQVDEIADNFLSEIKAPAWSDFPHIIEVDRLDAREYEVYLNNYNNGGSPFDIDYLKPYEPPGSIKYYPRENVAALQQQANAQAAVDQIKKQIQEILPGLASRAAELDQRFNAQPANYLQYANNNLGPNSDIYKVLFSNNKWKWIKDKGDEFKEKIDDFGFFGLVERADDIFRKMNKSEEDEIVSVPNKREFTLVIEQGDELLDELEEYLYEVSDKVLLKLTTLEAIGQRTIGQTIGAVAAAGGGATLLTAAVGAGAFAVAAGSTAALGAGLTIASPAIIVAGSAAVVGTAASTFFDVDIKRDGVIDRTGLPRSFTTDRQGRLLKRNEYIRLMLASYIHQTYVKKDSSGFVDSAGNPIDIFDEAIIIDQSFSSYRAIIDNALIAIKDVDNALVTSTSLDEFAQIFADLQNIEIEFNNIDLAIFTRGESYKSKIDGIVRYMISQQYDAIQYTREKAYRKKKFIVWPDDAKAVVQYYFPGKVFDNHQPDNYTG